MRLRTHITTSFIASYVSLRSLGMGSASAAITSLITSFIVNYFIDAGHCRKSYMRRRSFITHSFLGVWTSFTPLMIYVLIWVSGLYSLHTMFLNGLVVAGLIAYLTHMLLDSLTEGGIYLTPGRRVALAHLSYDGVADAATFFLTSLLAAVVVGADFMAQSKSLVNVLTEMTKFGGIR